MGRPDLATNLSSNDVLALQKTAGNAAVAVFLTDHRTPVKPSVSEERARQEKTDSSPVVQRAPVRVEDSVHDPLLDAYRRAHGQPPHGIDPATGRQIGPTDAQLKYGGILDEWVRRSRGELVAGPRAAPSLQPVASVWSESACGQVRPGMPPDEATRIRACLGHTRFVNMMSQSIANIRQVASPYAPGLAGLYAAVLRKVTGAGQSNMPTPTSPRRYTINNVQVAVTRSTTLPISSFTLRLEQNLTTGANGAWGGGELFLNEQSVAAIANDQPDVERTMYHEGVHFLSDIVTDANRQARATGPGVRELALDASLIRPFESDFENAVTPFWRQALTAHSTRAARDIPRVAQAYAGLQWEKLASEFLSRVEEAVYLAMRAGRAFMETDLTSLQQNWMTAAGYWPSVDITQQNMQAFLNANRDAVLAAVLPVALRLQRAFLQARPRR